MRDSFAANHVYLASIYAMFGRTEEAIAEREKAFAAVGRRDLPVINLMILDDELNRRFDEDLKLVGLR